jgi:hypothetical protein
MAKIVANKKNNIRSNDKRDKFLLAKDCALFALSIGATFLTPYKSALYGEIITTATSHANAYIGEWTSPISGASALAILFVGLVIPLLLEARAALGRSALLIIGLFGGWYLLHLRMLPFFLIVMLPYFFVASDNLYRRMREKSPHNDKYLTPILAALFVIPLYATAQLIATEVRPPFAAINALSTIASRQSLGHVYNQYDYGGWLIYVQPTRQVFTDGRSPYWTDAKGFSPFLTQVALMSGDASTTDIFPRFNIHYVILPADTPMETSSKKIPAFVERLRNLFPTRKQNKSVATLLLESGWCAVYRDSDAVILVEPGYSFCHK